MNAPSQHTLVAFLTHSESAEAIRSAMGETPHLIEPGDAAAAALWLSGHTSPATLLVEIPSAEAAPAMLDQLADAVHPDTKVIVTGTVDSYRFYEWLRQLGIHDYLLQPFTAAHLLESLRKASGPAAKAAPEKRDKKIIAAIGARGGVGTSSIITTLASCMAVQHKCPSVLVDLDPHFGSMALSLDLEPSRAMRDIWEKPDRIDSIYLERTMVKPMASLGMLSAEEPLGETILPQPSAGEHLLGTLKESYDLIAIDVPRQITSLTRYVLANADHVLLVSEPTVLCLRDTLRIRDYLVDTAKRPAPLLVLNREGLQPKSQLTASAFTKHVGLPVTASIAYHDEIADTVARGEPLLDNPKLKKPLEPLCLLADTLMGMQVTAAKPKRGLAALFGEK